MQNLEFLTVRSDQTPTEEFIDDSIKTVALGFATAAAVTIALAAFGL